MVMTMMMVMRMNSMPAMAMRRRRGARFRPCMYASVYTRCSRWGLEAVADRPCGSLER